MRLYSSLALFAFATAQPVPQPPSTWSCASLNASSLSGVLYERLSCTSPRGIPVFGPAGPITVNKVSFNLSSANLVLKPVTAPRGTLAGLDAIAATDTSVLAGINGPYFYRVDVASFFDSVCLGKTRANALQPPSAQSPNFGIGDGAVVSGGALLSSNCDCVGFSRPAVLSINGTDSRVDVLHRGDAPPAGLALDALSAGPNLVTTNTSGIYVDIPHDDDNIGNILEHSANTAFGITQDGVAMLVTTDGFDGCPLLNSTCGTNAFTLAYLMRDAFGAATAMGMDQGGSTTMWTKQFGIVSSSGGGPRPIFAGLFIAAV
jgi:hypothetical protein